MVTGALVRPPPLAVKVAGATGPGVQTMKFASQVPAQASTPLFALLFRVTDEPLMLKVISGWGVTAVVPSASTAFAVNACVPPVLSETEEGEMMIMVAGLVVLLWPPQPEEIMNVATAATARKQRR